MGASKEHTVGKKLFDSFTIMIVISLIIGVIGYLGSKKIEGKADNLFSVRLPSVDYLLQADRDLQQAISAERTMILSESGSEIYEEVRSEYEENIKQAEERWAKYKALPATSEQKAIFPLYEKALEKWKTSSGQVIYGMLAGNDAGRANALSLSLGDAKTDFEKMRTYLDKLTELTLKQAETESMSAKGTYRTIRNLIFAVTALGLIAGAMLIWLNATGIANPLKRAITAITEGAEHVSSASNQITEASQSLASGASQQAASIEETSSSLEEISSMIRQSSDNSKHADRLMKETKEVAEKANTYMEQMNASMKDIMNASEETSKIVKTIDEIAFQTNLLALNAAVEAARAGEAGAGFAVVADEVRNLAMRAAEAAKNTSELIEATVMKVDSGGDLTQTTREKFARVTESSAKVAELIGEIAAASDEQARGIGMITTAVEEMNKVTQQNAASAEESASACEEMNSQAKMMKTMVAELTTMVGRKNGSGKASQDLPTVERQMKDRLHLPEEAEKQKLRNKSVAAAQEVRPDQIIPMGDEDFQDF